MELSENQIIAQCVSGNWVNFGEIYDIYLPKIYQYVYYRTHHKQTAEDLTGSVFLKLIQNISIYDGSKSIFAPWLYSIARNTVIDHMRKNKPTQDLETAFNVASDHDVLGTTDASLKIDLVKAALSKLTPTQQEVLTLRVWDGLSHREIAQVLKISEDNSKVNFSRGVAMLKQIVPVSVLFAIILSA
jgi:RNA polymerase sigma-70 factor (ECF subfamily)